MRAFIVTLCTAAVVLLACTKRAAMPGDVDYNGPVNQQPDMPATSGDTLTYLALGDSYTIGEAVPANLSFPAQLAATLNGSGQKTAAPVIIARTGWTTDELQAAIKQANITKTYGLVTLLIGVNNEYRGYPISVYREQFVDLLNTAIKFAGGNAKHVIVVSIPDYSVTPFAASSNKAKIAADIDNYNAVNKDESSKKGVYYADITPISRQAANNTNLVATDGLHPSAAMYAMWINVLKPIVAGMSK